MTNRPDLEGLDAEPDPARWCCNGNAEDCALCTDPNPPYPFLCPGHPQDAASERIVGEATQATELDKSRRYLRPVASLDLPGVPDPAETHWSVYQWLPMFEAWATGMSLCGGSMRQGPLPEGTVVTCARCEEWRPRYERMLAPGYRTEDDDPDVLRRRAEQAEREVAAARRFAAEMRDFCSPHGVAADYADRLVEAMDRAKEGQA
jgi:hypothetical protein